MSANLTVMDGKQLAEYAQTCPAEELVVLTAEVTKRLQTIKGQLIENSINYKAGRPHYTDEERVRKFYTRRRYSETLQAIHVRQHALKEGLRKKYKEQGVTFNSAFMAATKRAVSPELYEFLVAEARAAAGEER